MTRRAVSGLLGFTLLLLLTPTASAAALKPGMGSVKFDSSGDEKAGVAERFSVPTHTFEYKLSLRHDLHHSGVKVYDLTFPSPVKTDVPENNTVAAELFVPDGEGPFPASIVLDILQGDALIARAQAMWLAQHGVAGMVVYMAHYGPRRPPGSTVRLLSTDIPKSVANVTQSVIDIRCAVAWLASRPEFDSEKLGLVGTSLGSLVGAVAAANEPRIRNVCLMLGGGGLVDAYYEHPMAKPYLPLVEFLGGKAVLKKQIEPVDPLTYAKLLKEKNLLMICASRDDIVPPNAGKVLWEATGKQRIIWLDSTHVGAGLYVMQMMREMASQVGGTK
jgi:cephalosporin-C deacetylase-like acetyl esterase